jgi:SAM-dependent methyltransferase
VSETAVEPTRRRSRALFAITILLGSFLLFLIQPMLARIALPRLGGAPAVWNSAMLVYQALLLGGYAYAHWLSRLRPRWQGGIHLLVLAAGLPLLPIGLVDLVVPPDAEPVLWVPWLFALSIGPLFLAVAAQAPLIQRWYARTGGGDPYPLYAASNLGSFGGLLAYPFLIEPLLTVEAQRIVWSIGYGVLLLFVLGCALRLPAAGQVDAQPERGPAPGVRTVARWMALAAVPSGLMLATSTFITTDVVAVPMLWVLPLGLYLLSFTVAFATRRAAADVITRFAPITLLLFGSAMIGGYQEQPWFSMAVALGLLFIASVALHTALFRARPAPARLTGFYLANAAGGVLGGIFAGLIAPVAFDWTYEYPLLILAAGALMPQVFLTASLRSLWHRAGTRSLALAGIAVTIGLLIVFRFIIPVPGLSEDRLGLAYLILAGIGMATIGARGPYMIVLTAALLLLGGYRALSLTLDPGARSRSYFGIYTVRVTDRLRELDHGTTVHGIQLTGSERRERTPTTYYSLRSGVGQAMTIAPIYGPAARIGVVGLGTGTLACYAQPGQQWRFYEIDPLVVRLARERFTFLKRCLPSATIRLGDARLRLNEERAQSLDLLVLDAFSSDAVPMHLLTREAFAGFGRVLARDGLLLVHVSNRFLDLEPVVAAAARDGGWTAQHLLHEPSVLETGASPSVWIALSRSPDAMRRLIAGDPEWRALPVRPDVGAWSDDYATILPLLKGLN